MGMRYQGLGRVLAVGWLSFALVLPAAAQSANRNVAPGFAGIAKSDKLVVLPVDLELFSLSAGGVAEPKADWTAAAQQHMRAAVSARKKALGLDTLEADEAIADDFAEQVALHAAVARSIAQHHAVGGVWSLPTKAGQLNWSFGDAMKALGDKTGARYGLFMWVRDSYASAERKAMMVLMAFAGIGVSGGAQVGYASLVDLQSGQVVWFNLLARNSGDLREAEPAQESIEALLAGFPVIR